MQHRVKGVGVVVLSIILVVGFVSPAVVVGDAPTPTPTDDGGDDSTRDPAGVYPAYFENVSSDELHRLPPSAKRAWAHYRMASLETGEDSSLTAAKNSSMQLLNASLQNLSSLAHVDSERHFQWERRSVRRLKPFLNDGQTGSVRDATIAVTASSNRSARAEVHDANAAFDRWSDELDEDRRQRVESHLQNAERALQKAERHRSGEENRRKKGGDNAFTKHDLQNHANAIDEYRAAWRHSRQATRFVADGVDPNVTITGTGYELGDGTVDFTVDGYVAHPDADRIESAELLVDGSRVGPVGLQPVTRTSVSTFEEQITHDGTAANVTVRLRMTDGRTVSESVHVEAPGFADERYEVTYADEESGVDVTVTGRGLREDDVVVSDVTPERQRSFQAAPFVQLYNYRDFETANVTIPLNVNVSANRTGELAVYKWDPDDPGPWQRVESEIDPESVTATASVDSFSYFSVFWVDNWEDSVTDTSQIEPRGNDSSAVEPIDTMLVIDTSGSMRGSRIDNARLASKRFVGALAPDDTVGLTTYASGSTLEHTLSTERGSVNRSIDSLRASGSTNTGAGIRTGTNELVENGVHDRQVMLLLSDGKTNRGPDPESMAEAAADEGIVINTIGLGHGIDEQELRDIADATGGDFYHVEDEDELPDVFDRVAQKETELEDSDEDDIPDVVEEMDLRMPVGPPSILGTPLGIDPTNPNTSGDDLFDGEAVAVEWVVTESDGDDTVTAKAVDAAVHPGTGETLTNELVKVSLTVPTQADRETEDPVYNSRVGTGGDDTYRVAQRDGYLPDERAFDGWPILSPRPDWMPDDFEDGSHYHMLLEPVVVVQHSLDVDPDDLPEEYEIRFRDDDLHTYGGSGELPRGTDAAVRRTMVVSGPTGGDSFYDETYADLGRMELVVDTSRSSFGGETVVGTSDNPYVYTTSLSERYEEVYQEAITIFEEAMLASYSLTMAPTKYAALKSAETMTESAIIRALYSGPSGITKVLDGVTESGDGMYQTMLYEHYDGGEDVVVGTGPMVAMRNEPERECPRCVQ